MDFERDNIVLVYPLYNYNKHMSTRGGHSGELANTCQNNAPVIPWYNCIMNFASQAF